MPNIKNSQDAEMRKFKGSVSQFLKRGRGWFPFKVPRAILKQIQSKSVTGSVEIAKTCVRVMSYNVLANSLTGETHYPIAPHNLPWENRYPSIVEEIMFLNPSILCL